MIEKLYHCGHSVVVVIVVMVMAIVNTSDELMSVGVYVCVVFQYDPGFQEDPSQPFSDSDDDINDTDG